MGCNLPKIGQYKKTWGNHFQKETDIPKRVVFIDGIRVITEEIDKVFSEIKEDAEFG